MTGRWSCSWSHELVRREIAEARMRTLVEVSPPFFDQNLRLGARTKPFEAQTLVAKLAVEALGDAILPRLAGFDQCRADAFNLDSCLSRAPGRVGDRSAQSSKSSSSSRGAPAPAGCGAVGR